MNLKFQEKYKFDNLSQSYFSSQFDLIILGRDNDEERHRYFINSLTEYQGKILRIDTCDETEKLIYNLYSCIDCREIEQGEKSLIPDLETLLKKIKISSCKVCVDITGLKQGILFLLIKLLTTQHKPSQLFAAYTEPTEYTKRSFSIYDSEEFDLYDKIIGITKAVPGFVKRRGSKKPLLVAPIGFDSQRLQSINENLKPEKIIPIVGFPSFMPGWNITAIKMNYYVLKNTQCYDYIESCEAASPFAIYNVLKEIYNQYIERYDIYIAPLGTRPHSLGAALFASIMPSCYLIYDFPIEKKFRSNKVLRASVYHLSRFIQ